MTPLLLVLLSGCSATGGLPPAHAFPQTAHPEALAHRSPAEPEPARAVDLSRLSKIEDIVPALAEKRVVFVGETHDRYQHHLNQLEIIRGLHARHADLAIGLEFFQQPYQEALDAYVAGELDEHELLRRTEYFTRWGYDFRLYAPILRFARENRIPLVALNLPAEITRKVGERGLDSLSEEERQWVPAEIDRSDEAYRRRLQRIYEEHPGGRAEDFEHFYQVQLLWDEGMAERAARYLDAHLQQSMVVLAGDGHLAYGSGIPDRLSRRVPATRAIVLNGWWGPLRPELADYLLFSDGQRLRPAGMLGVLLAEADEGMEVQGFSEDSAGQAAGLSRGDRVLALNGRRVTTMADVKVLMWDRRPGERVEVRYRPRKWLMFQGEARTIDVELR